MTVLDEIRNEVQAYGGSAWVYQLLVQANEGDASVSRSHVVIAKRLTAISPPEIAGTFPVSLVESDPLWQQIATELNISALQQVDTLTQQVQEADGVIQQLQQANAELAAEVERLTPKEAPSGN